MNQQFCSKAGYSWWRFVFYGNYFYGLCAVALTIEATLQQRLPLNGLGYYLFVFAATVLYYVYPYVKRVTLNSDNPRSNWYGQHINLMRCNQILLTFLLLIFGTWFLMRHLDEVRSMSITQWSLIMVFPMVAALYYGPHILNSRHNLRKIGWLKPIVIGFTWAGFVSIYPVLFYDLIDKTEYQPNLVQGLLFLKNFMFITLLGIMFDIKDYAPDYINKLKTFIVWLGLRRTIFSIVIPLSIAGLVSFMYYSIAHQFHHVKILLNIIPFLLLILVTWSLRKRRSIMFYLIVVDGLMLVKAACGSMAMLYF